MRRRHQNFKFKRYEVEYKNMKPVLSSAWYENVLIATYEVTISTF